MRVLVYVEGPSDRAALEALLEPVISAGRERRVGLRFLVLNDKVGLIRFGGRLPKQVKVVHGNGD